MIAIATASTDHLHLKEVLRSGLPPTLCTSQAPARYPVALVLSRRVTPQEAALIESSTTTRRLDDLGYHDVRLIVSDRRLLVTSTTLEELAAGLASELVQILINLATLIADRQAVAEATATQHKLDEDTRLDAVNRLVDAISLRPPEPTAIRDGEARWLDDGGSNQLTRVT